MVLNNKKINIAQSKEIAMPCRLGFYLRVAASYISFVKQFNSEIEIRKGKIAVNGKSILGLLVLGATWKTKLIFKAEGDDSEVAIHEIEEYFQDPENCLEETEASEKLTLTRV